MTKKQVVEARKTQKESEQFVAKVKLDMGRVGPANTYNSDQSGIKQEEHTGRTLHTSGVKKVEAVVQRMNATTHSFTVQPILNAQGEFLKPMPLVLLEPKGTFGPHVKKKIYLRCVMTSVFEEATCPLIPLFLQPGLFAIL